MPKNKNKEAFATGTEAIQAIGEKGIAGVLSVTPEKAPLVFAIVVVVVLGILCLACIGFRPEMLQQYKSWAVAILIFAGVVYVFTVAQTLFLRVLSSMERRESKRLHDEAAKN
jgi:quinol-cytochrome oxidoreductase complex cytochrome b subunit